MDRRGNNYRTPSPGHPLQHGYQLDDTPYGPAPQVTNDPYARPPQQIDNSYAQTPQQLHDPYGAHPSNLDLPMNSQQRLATPSDYLTLNAPVSALIRSSISETDHA
jgi:chitin synthase